MGYDCVTVQEIWGCAKECDAGKFFKLGFKRFEQILKIKKLRQDAKVLRDLVARGASEEEINETRKQLMQEVYDLLSVTLELRQKHSTSNIVIKTRNSTVT